MSGFSESYCGWIPSSEEELTVSKIKKLSRVAMDEVEYMVLEKQDGTFFRIDDATASKEIRRIEKTIPHAV